MGGSGSGCHYSHWWRPTKKDVVEDYRHLDANRWMREGILLPGVHHSGGWSWFRDAERKERAASIDYEVNTLENPPWLRLQYTFTERQDHLDYRVGLTVTRPHFGGLRWWFICPLVVNRRPCGRRVGKLYLSGRYFGCRHCHNLTYTSCQKHDKRVDALRRNPLAIEALLDDPAGCSPSNLLLALKAMRP
jgi:hypothetical protein